MIKKKLFLVCVLYFLVYTMVSSKTIELSSLGYIFEVPDTYSTNSEYNKTNNSYFSAIDSQKKINILVTSCSYDYESFEYMSSSDLDEYKKVAQQATESSYFKFADAEIFESNGLYFLVTEFKGDSMYQFKYSTVENGNLINFYFIVSGDLSEPDQDEIFKVAGSIKKIVFGDDDYYLVGDTNSLWLYNNSELYHESSKAYVLTQSGAMHIFNEKGVVVVKIMDFQAYKLGNLVGISYSPISKGLPINIGYYGSLKEEPIAFFKPYDLDLKTGFCFTEEDSSFIIQDMLHAKERTFALLFEDGELLIVVVNCESFSTFYNAYL